VPCLAVRVSDLTRRGEVIAGANNDRRLRARASVAGLARLSARIVLDDRAPILFPTIRSPDCGYSSTKSSGEQPVLGLPIVAAIACMYCSAIFTVVRHFASSLAQPRRLAPPLGAYA